MEQNPGSKFVQIILALTLLLVICEGACPHPNFLSKHACGNCNDDANDAHTFAVAADIWRQNNHRPPTGKNTVFIATHVGYHIVNDPQNGMVCAFTGSAPYYNCLASHGWGCLRLGTKIATHNLLNGHYYY